ncbi:hypothetical protein NPIL_156701, partial [Nephila pilipes]
CIEGLQLLLKESISCLVKIIAKILRS